MNKEIRISGAAQNNLKNIDLNIPWYTLCVVTGLSGSGKSSLAIDTIHAESRRRYLESLSTYARQFLERIDKPKVISIDGAPPSISIESRNNVKNSRSTVGTLTEIYDYMRVIYSRIGKIYCTDCNLKCESLSAIGIYEYLLSTYENKKLILCIKNDNQIRGKDLIKAGIFEAVSSNKIIKINDNNKEESACPLIDKVNINQNNQSRIIESIELGFSISKTICIYDEKNKFLRSFKKEFCCPKCFVEYKQLTPNKFSFNSPDGACKKCKGFGNILLPDLNLIVKEKKKSIEDGCISILQRPSLGYEKRRFLDFCYRSKIDIETPFENLSDNKIKLLLAGDKKYKGLYGLFKRLESKSYKMHVRMLLSKYRTPSACEACHGSRINLVSSNVRVANKTIRELCMVPIDELLEFLLDIKLSNKEREIVNEAMKQCVSRLNYLVEVGLEYLTLGRLGRSLSGGEAQRVNLAQQLGSRLTDTLYVLDEPSIGLHPKDIERLFRTLINLRNLDNTIVLIEHDLDIISKSDWIIELGPASGEKGGDLIYCGNRKDISKNSQSITNKYIDGTLCIQTPTSRRNTLKKIKIKGASKNNLNKVSFEIPLNCITFVTGVSGSGKSTLIKDCFYGNAIREYGKAYDNCGEVSSIVGLENLKEIVMITQEPIGASARSNPASYMKIYDEIRKIIANTDYSKKAGLKPGDFSFNTKGGRCEACQGEGKKIIEMQFLANLEVDCEECHGKRFNAEILNAKYKGKNINGILDLTVSEAIEFFNNKDAIINKLNILSSVGLNYVKLGQPSNTLSGGESQRIKIAKSLIPKRTKDVLYIFDEPSIGLHVEDLKNLINTFNVIMERENSIVIIEHNVELIKIADYIIDMGPGGGKDGGKIIATGTPEKLKKTRSSIIGKYLNL